MLSPVELAQIKLQMLEVESVKLKANLGFTTHPNRSYWVAQEEAIDAEHKKLTEFLYSKTCQP